MQVTVSEQNCISSGQCALAVPEVFDQREEDGVVVLLDSSPPVPLHAGLREAAALCPARAIRLGDAES